MLNNFYCLEDEFSTVGRHMCDMGLRLCDSNFNEGSMIFVLHWCSGIIACVSTFSVKRLSMGSFKVTNEKWEMCE